MPYLFFGIGNDKILESTSKIARLPMEMEHIGYIIAQNRYILI